MEGITDILELFKEVVKLRMVYSYDLFFTKFTII